MHYNIFHSFWENRARNMQKKKICKIQPSDSSWSHISDSPVEFLFLYTLRSNSVLTLGFVKLKQTGTQHVRLCYSICSAEYLSTVMNISLARQNTVDSKYCSSVVYFEPNEPLFSVKTSKHNLGVWLRAVPTIMKVNDVYVYRVATFS